MQTETLSLIMVGIFFIVNLIIGLKDSKNVKTIEDYAVGNKNWGTTALVMTTLATGLAGAMMIRATNNFTSMGMSVMAGPLAGLVSIPLRNIFLSKNTRLIKKSITMGDFVGHLYGKYSQIFSGIISGLFSTMYVGMEIHALSMIFENFLGIQSFYAIAISVIMISVYTAMGGMHAVLKTDILQFIFLVISIFLLASFASNKAGGIHNVLSNTPSTLLKLYDSKTFSYFISMFTIDSLFSAWILFPPCFQRILMTKNSYQVKKVYTFGYIGFFLFCVALGVMAFSFLILFPGDNGLVITKIVSIVPTYFHGIVIVGLIGLIFSSGDSFLHSAGLSIYYDVYSTIRNIKITERSKMKTSLLSLKLTTFFVGVFGLFSVYYKVVFFRADYIIGTISTSLFFPIIAGLLGLKTRANEFWISAAAGLVSFIILKLEFLGVTLMQYSSMIATLLNAATFLLVHLYNNRGFAWDSDMHDSSFSFFKKNQENILKKIFSLKSMTKLHDKIGNLYAYFGLLYIVVILASYFLWGSFEQEVEKSALIIKTIALVMCCLLATYRIWPRTLRVKYGENFWYLSLIYCLPFLSTTMLILSRGSMEYLLHLSISMTFLLILVNWEMALQIIFFGVLGACAVCYGLLDVKFSDKIFTLQTVYHLVYQTIFGSLIALFFAKRKSFSVELVDFNNNFLTNVNIRAGREIFNMKTAEEQFYALLSRKEIDLMKKIEEVKNFIDNKDFDKSKEGIDSIKNYVDSVADRVTNYFKLAPENVDLNHLIEQMRKLFLGGGIHEVHPALISKVASINCDYMETLRVITHLFNKFQEEILRITANNDPYITIYITDTKLSYTLKDLSGYIKTIDAIKITITSADYVDKDILDCEYSTELLKPENITPISVKDLSLQAMQKSLEAQYGYIKNSSTESEVILSLVLPSDIYAIRPKNLDLDTNNPKIQVWPEAEKIEKEFLKSLQEAYPDINMKLINKALEIIKKHHSHQQRKSGEPFFLHPIQVTEILLKILKNKNANKEVSKQHEDTILASLLHDILEDTSFHISDLQIDFGDNVTKKVLGVTKINYENRQKIISNKESFEKLTSQNPTVICIKLADRMHNLLTINGHNSEDKRKKIAQETLDFFVAPAFDLGLKEFAEELKYISEYILKQGKFDKN